MNKLTFKQAFSIAAGLTLGYQVVHVGLNMFFSAITYLPHYEWFYNIFINGK